jgi:hypothetical protein
MSDNSPSRATEHWFLDLDGVRSGPYQTPEVMSLIAEGEVMPHHRISTALKEKSWITILDWRFEQAKKNSAQENEAKEVKEVHSYIPVSARPPELVEPKVELANEETQATHSEVETAPIHEEPPADPVEEPSIEQWAETPIIESIIQRTPSHTEEPRVTPEIPIQMFEAPKSKRDPMAEMFDIIQTSKQKREAKSQQIAQQQNHAVTVAVAKEKQASSGLTRTIVIGLAITAVGFALGQMFQQSAPPAALTEETKSPTPATPSATKVEVVDRSTDKMTIRGQVETPIQKPTPSPARTAPLNAGAPRVPEKELQELKDLKKELQELKALKDEMKNNGGSTGAAPEEIPENMGEFDNGNIENAEIDSGFNYYPNVPSTTSGGATYDNGTGNGNYNAYPNQNPNPNQPNNHPQGPNSGIHY